MNKFLSVVALLMSALGAQTISTNPPFLTFHYYTTLSHTPPPPQTLQISAPGLSFTIVPYPDPATGAAAFLTLRPDSKFVYHDSATVIVSVRDQILLGNQAVPIWQLDRETRYEKIRVQSGSTVLMEIVVTLGVTSADIPVPIISSIVNGASFQPGPIAPGEILTILGAHLGPASGLQGVASGISVRRLSTLLAAKSVFINGFPAPLLYVQANQINAIVPYEIAGAQTADIVVNGYVYEDPSDTWRLPVADTAPAIFAVQGGTGPGIVFNADRKLNGDDRPAPAGSTVQVWATGSGVWNPAALDGLNPNFGSVPAASVSITIGGVPAQIVGTNAVGAGYDATSAGSGYGGSIIISCIVPDGLASGPQPVVLQIGDNSNAAQQVTMTVQ